MFLLGKKGVIRKYLPFVKGEVPFSYYISMLNGDKINQNILNNMLVEMSKEGSMKGVKYFLNKGANIYADALRFASQNGQLEIVKYLIEKGANIHANGDLALIAANLNGHLDIVKYLVEHGADITRMINLRD